MNIGRKRRIQVKSIENIGSISRALPRAAKATNARGYSEVAPPCLTMCLLETQEKTSGKPQDARQQPKQKVQGMKRNVPLGVKVSEVDSLLLSTVDTGHGARDFAGHEGRTTAGALVVEEDTIGQVHSVRLQKRDRSVACQGRGKNAYPISRKIRELCDLTAQPT